MGSRLKRSRNITQCSALCPTDISPSPTYKTEGIWGQCPNNQKFPDIWVSVGNHPRTEECFPKNGCPSILENTSPPLANPTQDTLPPPRDKTVPTRCVSPIHTIDHPNIKPLRNHGTSAGPSSRRQRIQHLLVKFLHTDPIPLRPWKSRFEPEHGLQTNRVHRLHCTLRILRLLPARRRAERDEWLATTSKCGRHPLGQRAGRTASPPTQRAWLHLGADFAAASALLEIRRPHPPPLALPANLSKH